jgi:hypothetical protein
MKRWSRIAPWIVPAFAVALGGCGAAAPVPVAAPLPAMRTMADPSLTYLDQGWSPELTRKWYWTPQGSRLVPYDWFLALEKIGNDEMFRSEDLIERFGYIAAPVGPDNPDGLPIGFAKGDDE